MTGTLEQRPFGRTGETVSLIGLGGAALHKHSYQHGLATVKHALDLGIRYFDTSPWYGIAADEKWISEGESQRIMGEGLEGTSKPHLLATKIDAWRTYNHSVEDCLAQVRDNLRVLRRDRVDVLLGHDMQHRRFWKPDTKEGEQMEIVEIAEIAMKNVEDVAVAVVVADSNVSGPGHLLAKTLADKGCETTVVADAATFAVMPRTNLVVLSARGVFADGAALCSPGNRAVAVAAKTHRVPVIVLAGTHQLSPLGPNDPEYDFDELASSSESSH